MKLVLTVILLATLGISEQTPVRFDNYSVFSIQIQNMQQRDLINSLLNEPSNYNLWRMTHNEAHLMVSPTEQPNFQRIMLEEKILVKLLISNVQNLIDGESKPNTFSK